MANIQGMLIETSLDFRFTFLVSWDLNFSSYLSLQKLQEGLTVSKDLLVEQSFEDLEEIFEPGDEFRFDAIVQFIDSNWIVGLVISSPPRHTLLNFNTLYCTLFPFKYEFCYNLLL